MWRDIEIVCYILGGFAGFEPVMNYPDRHSGAVYDKLAGRYPVCNRDDAVVGLASDEGKYFLDEIMLIRHDVLKKSIYDVFEIQLPWLRQVSRLRQFLNE